MRWLVMASLLLGGGELANGQPAPLPEEIEFCNHVAWDVGSESDLAGHFVYVEKDGVVKTPKDVKMNVTPNNQFPCADLGITTNSSYVVGVSAYDQSGNESGQTKIAFRFVDKTPPARPTQVCIPMVRDDVPGKFCGAFQPDP